MSLQEKRYPRETIQKVTVASELELSPMGRRATARRQHPLKARCRRCGSGRP